MQFRGQGATEYLVLLAVVLVIALVGVALLGFFPGTANDAQITESQIYWQSAGPIAITELNARYTVAVASVPLYIRMRNAGAYPVRLTGVVGADGGKITVFWSNIASTPACSPSGTPSNYNIADYFYLAPGEERYFSRPGWFGSVCDYNINAVTGSSTNNAVGGATSVCQNSTQSPGMVVFRSFGFEYIQYVEGQQITKRQLGSKPLIIKCREPY